MSPRHNPRSDRERQRDSRQVREDAGGRHLSTWLEPAAASALAQARATGETIAGFVNRAMVEAGRDKFTHDDAARLAETMQGSLDTMRRYGAIPK